MEGVKLGSDDGISEGLLDLDGSEDGCGFTFSDVGMNDTDGLNDTEGDKLDSDDG